MRRRIVQVVLAFVCLALLASGFTAYSTIRDVPKLFKRNAELKAQGYYMGEFEFKMVASQYYLNEGRYLDAYRTLRRVAAQMENMQGLNRMPDNASGAEMMSFLLDQQDPATGAFMDRNYPSFSYFAPTINVVDALAGLSRDTGRPLALKHPLRFLDEINTPERLRTYLDSLLYVGELSTYFPGPGPYGPGVSEIAEYATLEEAGVYRFSEPWKTEIRRWFYETQDPATGFWGARIGNAEKWRQKTDINATFHILKLVLEDSGENQSPQFPLRYAGALARGVLKLLDTPIPEGTTDQHDWGLKQYQGAKMLTLLLWPHLADSEKDEVRRKFRSMLIQSYSLYRPDDGGFAYYTSDRKADIDGTGLATGVLKVLGVLPGTLERERLWEMRRKPVSRLFARMFSAGSRLSCRASATPSRSGSIRIVCRRRLPTMTAISSRSSIQTPLPGWMSWICAKASPGSSTPAARHSETGNLRPVSKMYPLVLDPTSKRFRFRAGPSISPHLLASTRRPRAFMCSSTILLRPRLGRLNSPRAGGNSMICLGGTITVHVAKWLHHERAK